MMMGGCGITKVHFLGEMNDWESLKKKIQMMMTYDEPLEEWGTLLLGIIAKFQEQMEGKIDREFWCNIISKEKGYRFGASGITQSAYLITGWLAVFLFLSNSSEGHLNDSGEQSYGYHEIKDVKVSDKVKKARFNRHFQLNEVPNSFVKCPVKLIYSEMAQMNLSDLDIDLEYFTGFTQALCGNRVWRPQMGIGFGFKQVKKIRKVKKQYAKAMKAIKKAFHS